MSGNIEDDSEDRTVRRRTDGDRPVVLLISADSEVAVLADELDGSHTEASLLRTMLDVESQSTRNGFQPPDLVFLDLDLCEGREDAIALVRRLFPQASLVALARNLDAERAARLLLEDIPSLKKPISAGAFVGLAARLSRRQNAVEPPDSSARPGTGRLDALLEAYSSVRGLSPQQRFILRLHLAGNNDKEIAFTCSCSEATVYEHWRRMARKAGGMHKSCVINDFHKFLDR